MLRFTYDVGDYGELIGVRKAYLTVAVENIRGITGRDKAGCYIYLHKAVRGDREWWVFESQDTVEKMMWLDEISKYKYAVIKAFPISGLTNTDGTPMEWEDGMDSVENAKRSANQPHEVFIITKDKMVAGKPQEKEQKVSRPFPWEEETEY